MEHRQAIKLLLRYPEHGPRAGRPQRLFNQAKARLKAQGLYRCVVCGAEDDIELHHTHVEHSLQAGISVAKLNQLLGLHLADSAFTDWINSPQNLEPLCLDHHRGPEGIHLLPTPLWEAMRCWRDDLPSLVEAHGNI